MRDFVRWYLNCRRARRMLRGATLSEFLAAADAEMRRP